MRTDCNQRAICVSNNGLEGCTVRRSHDGVPNGTS